MPCNSDHMLPTQNELHQLQINNFFAEIGYSYHSSDTLSNDKQMLDDMVSQLCAILSGMNTRDLSLELQLWWREHQRADRERRSRERSQRRNYLMFEQVMGKLTTAERDALRENKDKI